VRLVGWLVGSKPDFAPASKSWGCWPIPLGLYLGGRVVGSCSFRGRFCLVLKDIFPQGFGALGGGFYRVFLFSPIILGEMIPF